MQSNVKSIELMDRLAEMEPQISTFVLRPYSG